MKTVERHKKTDFGDVWYVNAADGTYRFAVYKYDDDNDTIYLSNVFVKEDSRRQGYGNEILASAEDYANRLGASVICLKVLSGSDVHRWYKRHGYEDLEKDEEERGYMWMKKELKRVNESVWADIRNKSLGKEVRGEYELTDEEKVYWNRELELEYFKKFINYVVYDDLYEVTLDGIKRSMSHYIMFSGIDHKKNIPIRDFLIPYVVKNWTEGKKFYDYLKRKENEEREYVRKCRYKEVPDKSIDEVVNDWWDDLDEEEQLKICIEDGFDDDPSQYYPKREDHDPIPPQTWWENCSHREQLSSYTYHAYKKNESVWNDIRKKSLGQENRTEELLTDDEYNFLDDCKFEFSSRVVWDNEKFSLEKFKECIKRQLKGYENINVENVIKYVDDKWDELRIEIDKLIDIEEKEKEDGMNESVWNDIRKKSLGQEERDEDKMTQKDLDDLDKYIMRFANEVVYGRGMGEEAATLDNFCDHIRQDHDVKGSNKDKIIEYVKEMWFDELCDDVTGTIEQVQKEYNQDMNESVWNDIRDKSLGKEERDEDKMTPDDFDVLDKSLQVYAETVVCEDWDDWKGDIIGYDAYEAVIKTGDGMQAVVDDIENYNLDKICNYVKKHWDNLINKINEYIDEVKNRINSKTNESCDGVPGGITPANVGGMGEISFPGPNGEPGSGDLPMPTGKVYQQVAPFGIFIQAKKGKKRKKKFRKEDEPCVHSPNAKVYDYVDDYREYVDRTYNNMDRK